MTNMKPMSYEDFTNLNIPSNLADFILYLQDRNVVHFAPHVNKFGNTVLGTIKEMHEDWLTVAKEELKERNDNLALGLNK